MKQVRVRVREIVEATHVVVVDDDFPMYSDLDNWANEIGEQDSTPDEIHEIQIDSVIAAEVVPMN